MFWAHLASLDTLTIIPPACSFLSAAHQPVPICCCALQEQAIQLGAVDVMLKPLHVMKLKTLWMHTVSGRPLPCPLPASQQQIGSCRKHLSPCSPALCHCLNPNQPAAVV